MLFVDSLAPLRYPAFRYLVAGRVVTMLGNAIAPISVKEHFEQRPAFGTGGRLALQRQLTRQTPPASLDRDRTHILTAAFLPGAVTRNASGDVR